MVGDGPYGLAYRRYMETLFTGYKKITANGLVRRGRPEGVPLVRFDHILFKHNGRLLRATSHEPRTTAIATSRGLLEAMYSI